MKEVVTDITEVLRSLYTNLDTERAKNNLLQSANKALRTENEQLKQRLSRYETPKLNSDNSSIPPSKDDIASQAIKRTRSLRPLSTRKTGGQMGHKGNTLLKSEEVDEVFIHTPEHCMCCGKSLQDIDGSLFEERQSIDIPLPVRPKITNHVGIEKRCECGHSNRALFPEHVKPGVSYGVNVHALIAYLSTMQHIPFKRLTELLKDFYGLQISQGTVSNILRRMRKQGAMTYNNIRQEILCSEVVGADETGMYLDKKLHWMWVFQNELATYIYNDASRGKASIALHFPQGLPQSTLVSDRHSSYFGMDVKGHQICLAHLLRELVYLTELDKKQDWSSRMLTLLRDSIHWQKTNSLKQTDIDQIKKRYQILIEEDISHLRYPFRSFQKGLKKHSEHLFVFLENPEVPPDNNASERAIRTIKVKQKVSGQFKSEEGADAFCVIRSITDTAKKNKQDPFLVLIEIAQNILCKQISCI